jgi:hypothetical protein
MEAEPRESVPALVPKSPFISQEKPTVPVLIIVPPLLVKKPGVKLPRFFMVPP